jgi:hypothetical protein
MFLSFYMKWLVDIYTIEQKNFITVVIVVSVELGL